MEHERKIEKMPIFWDDLKKNTQKRIGDLNRERLKNRVITYVTFEYEDDKVIDWRLDYDRL